jgi:hypothetical protein
MKEIRVKTFVGLIGAFCMMALPVAPASASAGWTEYGIIGKVSNQPVNGTETVFVTVSVTNNPQNCDGQPITVHFHFTVTTDRQKRLFAMVLAAKMAGNRIQLYVTGNCHDWDTAEVDRVMME